MIDFLLGILFGLFLFYIGMRIVIGFAMKRLEHKLVELSQSLEVHRNMIEARVEEHNGVFYVYNASDETFIVQGTTVKEIHDAIDLKFKGTNITITQGEKDVLARLMSTK